jgi:hypothetical protein
MRETTANRTPRWRPDAHTIAFLVLILTTGPLAWSIDLILKFVLASNACLRPSPSHEWLFTPGAFILIDVVAFAITAAATWESYRAWSATSQRTSNFYGVTETGEKRQHFLTMWGMLIGAMFLSAIAFSFVVNLVVQPCTY